MPQRPAGQRQKPPTQAPTLEQPLTHRSNSFPRNSGSLQSLPCGDKHTFLDLLCGFGVYKCAADNPQRRVNAC